MPGTTLRALSKLIYLILAMRQVILLSWCGKRNNWDTESLNNLTKVTQLANGRGVIKTSSEIPESMLLNTNVMFT